MERKCETCSNSLTAKQKRFCSLDCYNNGPDMRPGSRGAKIHVPGELCQHCGNQLTSTNQKQFCSHRCASSAMRTKGVGSRNHVECEGTLSGTEDSPPCEGKIRITLQATGLLLPRGWKHFVRKNGIGVYICPYCLERYWSEQMIKRGLIKEKVT